MNYIRGTDFKDNFIARMTFLMNSVRCIEYLWSIISSVKLMQFFFSWNVLITYEPLIYLIFHCKLKIKYIEMCAFPLMCNEMTK